MHLKIGKKNYLKMVCDIFEISRLGNYMLGYIFKVHCVVLIQFAKRLLGSNLFDMLENMPYVYVMLKPQTCYNNQLRKLNLENSK